MSNLMMIFCNPPILAQPTYGNWSENYPLPWGYNRHHPTRQQTLVQATAMVTAKQQQQPKQGTDV
jgi:hypothetical protein